MKQVNDTRLNGLNLSRQLAAHRCLMWYDLADVAERKPYILRDLALIFWVGSAVYISYTTSSLKGRLGSMATPPTVSPEFCEAFLTPP